MNKIEDPVATRIHASNEIRPCHRTLGRDAGSKLAKISLRGQFGEIGHLALAHELPQQFRIHAVNSQNDETVIAAPIGMRGPARQ